MFFLLQNYKIYFKNPNKKTKNQHIHSRTPHTWLYVFGSENKLNGLLLGQIVLKNAKKRQQKTRLQREMPTFAKPKLISGHRPTTRYFCALYGGGRRNPHTATD